MRRESENRRKRQSTYNMLVVVALAIAAGRIAVVAGKEGTAFLSANDRSRWCTVACLVERGTYAIDQQVAIEGSVIRTRRPWATIDKVRHLDRDGVAHEYSSKPPLFPTLVAGVYLLVNLATGMTMTDQPVYVPRIILALVNLPLLALFYYGTIHSLDRICHSEWTRRFAAFGCCFGTMLLPFTISLNNHLPAAAATAVVLWVYLYAAEEIDDSVKGQSNIVARWRWMVAGIAAAFAAANELPALSMTVFWFLLFALLDRRSILPFAVGLAIVAVGFFGTNWVAHQSLRPPYAHRGNGDLITTSDVVTEDPNQAWEALSQSLTNQVPIATDSPAVIEASYEAGRWRVETAGNELALLKGDGGWELRFWDDWYDYPGTYWRDGVRKGVDVGEPSRLVYLFHMTLGHHGIFSLTPMWLLMPLGLIASLGYGPADFRRLAFAVLVATVVCLLFYVARPLVDRNYGGVSICFRWMLWFAPLWLLVSAPVMQTISEHPRRRIWLKALLAFSVFSMATSLHSPWQSPWLYQFWQFLGWIEV